MDQQRTVQEEKCSKFGNLKKLFTDIDENLAPFCSETEITALKYQTLLSQAFNILEGDRKSVRLHL